MRSSWIISALLMITLLLPGKIAREIFFELHGATDAVAEPEVTTAGRAPASESFVAPPVETPIQSRKTTRRKTPKSFEELWLELKQRYLQDGVEQNFGSNRSAADVAYALSLCKEGLWMACSVYYGDQLKIVVVLQNQLLLGSDGEVRPHNELRPGDEKLKAELKARGDAVHALQIDNCLNGIFSDCPGRFTVAKEITTKLLPIYADFCEDGLADYCALAGERLLEENDEQTPLDPETIRSARAFIDLACQAGDLFVCSKLLSGPLDSWHDPTAIAALALLEDRCNGNSSYACMDAGIAYLDHGDPDRALPILDLGCANGSGDSCFLLAGELLAKGDRPEGMVKLRKSCRILATEPNSSSSPEQEQLCLDVLGNDEEAAWAKIEAFEFYRHPAGAP